MLQLRVARGLRTLTSRLNQGVVLSRGSAHLHLVFAAQVILISYYFAYKIDTHIISVARRRFV